MPGNKNKGSSHLQRSFKMREMVMSNAVSSTVFNVTTTSTGTGSSSGWFAPLGMSSSVLTGGAFGNAAYVEPPLLKWLYNQSANFGYYRVLNATLVFIGNAGSTSTGQIAFAGVRNFSDTINALNIAYAQGPYAKVFDIASSASRECRLRMPVDSSWKKVSGLLTVAGNAGTMIGGTNQVVAVASADDVGFGGFTYVVVGAPNSATIGNFALEYEVEFRDPISVGINL